MKLIKNNNVINVKKFSSFKEMNKPKYWTDKYQYKQLDGIVRSIIKRMSLHEMECIFLNFRFYSNPISFESIFKLRYRNLFINHYSQWGDYIQMEYRVQIETDYKNINQIYLGTKDDEDD